MAYESFAYYYDRLMEDMPYAEWLDFLNQCWAKYGRPATIADIGCGTGNIAIPLARQGCEVFGIDLSEDMLAVARHKEAEEGRNERFQGRGSVTWLHQDMRDWSLLEPVDAVVSLCDCMNYLLEEEDVSQAIRQAYAGLREGGLFIFDAHTRFQLETYAEQQPFFLNEDDIAYIWTSDYDAERCEVEHALTIFVKEDESSEGAAERFRRVEEVHTQRAYPLEWLQRQLREAGFGEVELYADFVWKPVTDTTERAFFVARK